MRYITVEDLSFYYDKEPVLEHINYSVDSGEFVTLTGENGGARIIKKTVQEESEAFLWRNDPIRSFTPRFLSC